jgi:CRISPR-associated endonuclease Cas2
MLHVVCYDISDDNVRTQMSNRLLDFGVRIQESVFELLLNDELLERMMERLGSIPLGDNDKVRVYRICHNCTQQIQIYGPGEVTLDPPFYVI